MRRRFVSEKATQDKEAGMYCVALRRNNRERGGSEKMGEEGCERQEPSRDVLILN